MTTYNKHKTAYLSKRHDWVLLGRGRTAAPGALSDAWDNLKEYFVMIEVREGDLNLGVGTQEADCIDDEARELLLDAHDKGVYSRVLSRLRGHIRHQISQKEHSDEILASRMYSKFKEEQ